MEDSNTKQMQTAVAWLLRIGVFIALILVGSGGIRFLLENGYDLSHYQVFHSETIQNRQFSSILSNLSTLSANSLIMSGIIMLIFTQIIRVACVTWYFFKGKEKFFTLISVLLLVAVILLALGGVTV